MPLLASIPSPPFNSFHVGPLQIHIYGILMGLAVATAYVLTTRRYVRFGGDKTVVEKAAFWAVVIGFSGARLAYVSTHLSRYRGGWTDWLGVLRIWEGGLALFGGLAGGAAAAAFVMWRHRGRLIVMMDAIALGLPAAQAIGRWGNYFNQELFGTPSSLPWAVEISPANRPAAYVSSPTFHPTFLYESLWNVGIIALLVWLERKRRLRRGILFALYLILYAVGRFGLELIRTDTTFRFLGLSRNAWVSVGVVLIGAGMIWFIYHRKAPAAANEAGEVTTEEAATGESEEASAEALPGIEAD